MPTYATAGQLADFMFGDAGQTALLPSDVDRLLDRASELIQDETFTAVYAHDDNGLATDSKVLEAFMKATCAQVEFWLTGNEEDDISGPLESMSSGGQGQGYGSGPNRLTPMYVAPRAARLLRNGGVLGGPIGDSRGYDWTVR